MESLSPVFSVHELNEYVDLMLGHDPNLSKLTVDGELSGCKRHPNGHLYFTLKDELASVSCVMWRQNVQSLRFLPRDGMRVRLVGSAALYTRDGRFQLYATALQKQGEGDLFAAFCKYRDSLAALGWFDEAQKKPIPKLPTCVGVVTSASGAALQDIRNIIGRRFPKMPIRLYPAAVQGGGAAAEIANAIRRADAERVCDVLIVGRGGGSMEDLWAFNEPPVAEAIHDCTIPVISAVGHETDFSISDFVADLRAPTPSAAAELAVPEYEKLQSGLADTAIRLRNALQTGVAAKRNRLELLWSDAVALRAERKLADARQRNDGLLQALSTETDRRLERTRQQTQLLGEHLLAYSPQKTLARGFALIFDAERRIVTDAAAVSAGDPITVRLHSSAVTAVVTGKEDTDGTGTLL
ncbi:MAG: exodeoxyribonuclease VII large subunit [Clostridia bacterium]|nr:exodeoxyribonuclease VII large subunit [Clostridia bacterium]